MMILDVYNANTLDLSEFVDFIFYGLYKTRV